MKVYNFYKVKNGKTNAALLCQICVSPCFFFSPFFYLFPHRGVLILAFYGALLLMFCPRYPRMKNSGLFRATVFCNTGT
jgi:hypothetical protein